MAEEGLDHVMDGKEDQSIFQVIPKITFFQPTWTLYKCKGDIPPLSIVRKEAPSFIIQVVTDLMEEREQLRFTILSLVIAVILLALLILACALAFGFHLQKKGIKSKDKRSRKRKPIHRTDSFASTTSTILMDLDSDSDSSMESAGLKPIQPLFLL